MHYARLTIRLILALGLILGIILFIGCDGEPTRPVGRKGPSNPIPIYGAEDVATTTTFEWAYEDTTADSLFYDFYLGLSNPLPRVATRITDTFYTLPGTMIADTTYYWKVIVYDNDNDSVSSSTWRFTTENSIRFPIMPGNRWTYAERVYAFGFDPPELRDSVELADTIVGFSFTETRDTATIADTILTFLFYTEWIEAIGGGFGDEYFNNTDSGFYMYAYSDAGIEPPKSSAASKILYEFRGRRFSTLDELYRTFRYAQANSAKSSTPPEIEDPPIREIAYPLEIGRKWTYRSTSGHPWLMEKQIIDDITITVPAGQFDCYTIRWFWDTDNDGEWDTDIDGYDYISSIGTVRRVFYFYDILVTNYELDSLGTFDFTTEYELTDFESK